MSSRPTKTDPAEQARESVPQVLLERLALGELPPEQATAVRRELVERGELHRLEALQAEDAEILRQLPPRVVAAAVEERRRAQETSRGLRLPMVALGGLLAAAVALVAVMPGDAEVTGLSTGTEPAAWGERIKGDPDLLVHRQGAQGPELLGDGAPVAPGDTVQLQVMPGDYVGAHALVVSVDGRGSVTRHWQGELPEGGAVALPKSFRLDDAPDFERFYLVLSREGPVPAVVVENLRDGLEPDAWTHLTVTLVKEGTP